MIEELFETLVFLSESLSSARARYLDTEKVSQQVFDKMVGADPSSKKKYVEWMLQQYVLDPNSFDTIIQNIRQFDSFVEKKQIQNADIVSYGDLAALEAAVQEVVLKGPTKTQKRKSSEKEIKRDKVSVYSDENIEVIVPQSHEQSCLYGAGTKWCTTEKSPVKWDDHDNNPNIKLYYVIDKKNNAKWAVLVTKKGDKQVYDAKDTLISFDSMVRQLDIRINGFENLFQPLYNKEILNKKNTVDREYL